MFAYQCGKGSPLLFQKGPEKKGWGTLMRKGDVKKRVSYKGKKLLMIYGREDKGWN
jgi:hypothetical protein